MSSGKSKASGSAVHKAAEEPQPKREEPAAETQNAPSVADVERMIRAEMDAKEQDQALAAQKAAEEAQLEQELKLEDEVTRFKRETPDGLDCYRVNPDQPKNVVLRAQCFQPGNLLRAVPGELADHQLAICTKV